MFDLCSMSIGLPKIVGTESQTITQLTALSCLQLDVPGSGSQCLFTKRRLDRWRKFHSLQVAGHQKGEALVFPHTTFSGLLTMNRETVPPKDQSIQTTWDMLFSVGVSINRAIQAQALKMTPKSKRGTRNGRYSLLLSADAASQVKERLLVPATNILDRSETRQMYAKSRPAEAHLREFILELCRECGSALRQTTRIVPTVTIGTLEVCWDFYDEQPVITVELMKAKVMRIAKSLRAKYAPTAAVTAGHKIDSPSVSVELIADLTVRFYAKSIETIRFEVVYGPERIKALQNQKGVLSLDDAMQTARSIRLDAAIHINTFFGLMRKVSEGCENDATPDELIHAVMAAFPDVFEAKNILCCLALYRHVRTFPNDPRLPGLRKLKKLFVLENDPASPGARNYVVTPRFQDARRQILFSKAMPRRFWVKPRPRRLRGGEN